MELHAILNEPSFNIDKDFDFLLRVDNTETLRLLNFDRTDVVEELKTLSLSNYSETLIDNGNINTSPLFVFGKMVTKHLIYI